MSGIVYDVAIHLAAQNQLSGVLAVLSKDVLGLHTNVEKLKSGFSSLKPVIVGAVAAIAGVEILKGTAHIVEAGMRLVHFQAQLQAATGDLGKVAAATSAAWAETSKNLNTDVADNVKNIQHLINITGSLPEAQRMLHPFTMADTALASVKDDQIRSSIGAGNDLNTYNFARSLEQLGVTQDEGKLDKYTDGLTRAMIAMRGLVDGSKYFQAINNAGASRYGWNEDFVTHGLGPLIQATNGRIGSQLYQLDRSYGQGVSTQMMAQGGEKYGLWKNTDEHWENGKFKGMEVGSVFENAIRQQDPVKWAGDVRDMLQKKGVNIMDAPTMANVIAEMTRGNKNLGAGMSELIMPGPYQALMKERKNIDNVPEDAVGILQKNDPSLALKAFHTQWDNLMTSLGAPMVQTATDGLNALARGLNSLATTFAAHPDAVRAAGFALVGLGAGLTILGGAAVAVGLAALMPGGAFALGITSLLSALAGIAAFQWPAIQTSFVSGWTNFMTGIKAAVKDTFNPDLTTMTQQRAGVATAVLGIVQLLDAALLGIPSSLGAAFSPAIQGVVDNMKAAIVAIPGEVEGAIASAFHSIAASIMGALGSIGSGAPSARNTPSTPSSAGGRYHPTSFSPAPPRSGVTVHTAVNMDGRRVAEAVSRHQVAMAEFPTSGGGQDTHASWPAPGSTLVDVT